MVVIPQDLSTTPCLGHGRKFVLGTDASDVGSGRVPCQRTAWPGANCNELCKTVQGGEELLRGWDGAGLRRGQCWLRYQLQTLLGPVQVFARLQIKSDSGAYGCTGGVTVWHLYSDQGQGPGASVWRRGTVWATAHYRTEKGRKEIGIFWLSWSASPRGLKNTPSVTKSHQQWRMPETVAQWLMWRVAVPGNNQETFRPSSSTVSWSGGMVYEDSWRALDEDSVDASARLVREAVHPLDHTLLWAPVEGWPTSRQPSSGPSVT
jgi:hypothetical protein